MKRAQGCPPLVIPDKRSAIRNPWVDWVKAVRDEVGPMDAFWLSHPPRGHMDSGSGAGVMGGLSLDHYIKRNYIK